MAKNDQEVYQPIPGDIRIQEVRADHFSIRFYDGRRWHVEGYMTKEEVQKPPVHWHLMDESECKGKKRQYYRCEK